MSCAERKPPGNERRVRALAESQFGLVTQAQAIEAGFSPSAITRRVQGGLWERTLPCVYRIVGAPPSDQQVALAAALWAGDGALVSHGTAGALWAIEGVRAPKPELWVPAARNPTSDFAVVHRGTRLDRADRTQLGPIPITTPVRTLIDVASRLEDDRLAAAMESVFRLGLGTPRRLAVRLDALQGSGRPGAGRLARLLAARGGGRPLESRLEARVWLLLSRSGLRMPVRQHWVTTGRGRYRVDFAWPDIKLALECDSWRHHGDRVAFGRDRARFSDLVAVGWRVLTVTWDACRDDPHGVVNWVASAVAHAA